LEGRTIETLHLGEALSEDDCLISSPRSGGTGNLYVWSKTIRGEGRTEGGKGGKHQQTKEEERIYFTRGDPGESKPIGRPSTIREHPLPWRDRRAEKEEERRRRGSYVDVDSCT